MSKKSKKIIEQLGSVMGTALVAGAIAFVQNLLSQKGIECGPQMSVGETGAIGSALASLKIAISKISYFG